jgi:DNA-binding MarR family transcriptional regulator
MLRRQEYPGFLIALARRRLKLAALAHAGRHGLSHQQFWVLVALHEQRATSQAELAERLHVDAPTASRVIATLARRRLVRVEQDREDRRRARLHLTRAGEALARDLAAAASEIRAALVDGLTEEELDGLRRGLHRIISNLEALEQRASREAS